MVQDNGTVLECTSIYKIMPLYIESDEYYR